MIKKDSAHKEVVYRDSIHEVVKWKYRTDKGLKLPCDTLLKIVIADCDTVIFVDSMLISKLKVELLISNLIIENQQSIVKRDSVQIDSLKISHKKEIRKHKRQKRLFMAIAVALGLVAVVK